MQPYMIEMMLKEWAEGEDIGDLEVILQVGEEVFWGSDRIGYLRDHLTELRMARL